MARIVITQADLLDALATASAAPEDARTLYDLVAEAGIGEKRVRLALKALQTQGRLVVHRVPRPDITGKTQQVPAYTILPAKKAKR